MSWTDESIEVQVRARKEQELPGCGEVSEKIHDTRLRVKRDITLRAYQISLVVQKRRFCCVTCQAAIYRNGEFLWTV